MALAKQTLNVNFGRGLDTKTDPKQVVPGKFLALQNVVFQKGGLLQKRNGFQKLFSVGSGFTTLTTFNQNLTAIGTNLSALVSESSTPINTGSIQPVQLSVLPVVRKSSSQTTADVAIASNGLACATWLDSDASSYYQIVDSTTGQVIVSATALPSTATMSRAFVLGPYLIVTFLATVSAATHLQYISIPISAPTSPSAAADLSTQVSGLTAGYDGIVANNTLYIAWNGSDGGGAIRISSLSSTLVQGSTVTIAGKTSTFMSVTADNSGGTPVIWVTFWASGTTNAFSAAYSHSLVSILASTQTITSKTLISLTSAANAGVLRLFYQVSNTYSFSPNARTDFIDTVTCTQAGSVGSTSTILRSVGLGSKAFYFSSTGSMYFLASYGQAYQPTYFLVDQSGNVIGKLAYSNGPGYVINQVLPGVNLSGTTAQVGYLFKDLLVSVNKTQGVSSTAGIYSQTGINLASFNIVATNLVTSEIGNNLHIAGGFLWMFDGVKPVEHGFHVWPEDIQVTTAGSGGSITAQQYYYIGTYEWTDAQGNIHRSAPSVPFGINVGSGSSTNTINFPTLRLTYKVAPNKVRLVLYRWSAAQQVYYQATSITSPTLNDPTADSVTITDTLADSSILGNPILYTTGGVVENIAAPACSAATLFKSRLCLINAENPNEAWFSKQVIQGVPVEMSDQLTLFVPPTTGAQGGTGPTKCIAPLDDKWIFWKRDAIYYIVGNGPDNTGAQNDFSDPVFITSTVGSTNQQSLVIIPSGIIFQSDKGFWLLGRDLSTTYIGAPVEAYNSYSVLAALTVPGTNQVRFTLSNGVTLMYDYFYNEWATFSNVPAISSTIYGSLHTYLDSNGNVLQENPGSYVDNGSPVLMSLLTGWFSLAGLQGFERAYYFTLLGEYFSPHFISLGIAYDYDPSIYQIETIRPTNYSPAFGGDALYGSSTPFGGGTAVEFWRAFLKKQKCQSFQISLTEVYNPAIGQPPGAGFTLSGLALVVGSKRTYSRPGAAKSVG